MCDMCDENDGEMVGCQDCGRLICFDVKYKDDIVAPAYVTASGDLFCSSCGQRYDQEEEEAAEEFAYIPDEYMDDWEFEAEDDNAET